MTCKDCYHYEVCGGFLPSDSDKDVWDLCAKGKSDKIYDIEDRCSEFKEKSLIVEMPCKPGDIVYVLYPQVKYIEKYHVIGINFGEKHDTIQFREGIVYTILDKKYDEFFGKTIFLTREEAEKVRMELKR